MEKGRIKEIKIQKKFNRPALDRVYGGIVPTSMSDKTMCIVSIYIYICIYIHFYFYIVGVVVLKQKKKGIDVTLSIW